MGPVSGPLSGVIVQATEGQMGIDATPMPAATTTFETTGQTFALRFGGTRADLVAGGEITRVIQHIRVMGDISLQGRERLPFLAPMRLAQDAQFRQRLHRTGQEPNALRHSDAAVVPSPNNVWAQVRMCSRA